MQATPAPIPACQSARCGLADVSYAQRVDESLQRDFPPRLYGREQLADQDLAEAFMCFKLDFVVARLQREDVGRPFYPSALKKQGDLFFAQALDVKRMSRYEMLQVLGALMRAGKLPGAPGNGTFFSRGSLVPHDVSLERTRAHCRKLIRRRLGTLRPAFENDAEHLRNDIAGALQCHRITNAHVEGADVGFVMEAGIGDDDTANSHRSQFRHGRERPSTTDLNVDSLHDGRRLLRRELVGNRPTRIT